MSAYSTALAQTVGDQFVLKSKELNTIALQNDISKDAEKRADFVSKLNDLKALFKMVLKESGGPKLILEVSHMPYITAVYQGLQGDDVLCALYLDELKSLSASYDSRAAWSIYVCAMRCKEKNPSNLALSKQLLERLREAKAAFPRD